MKMENKNLAVQTKGEISPSERFTNMVMKEFNSSAISVKGMDDYHKRLCQSYFISLDGILKTNEQKRDEKKNTLPFIWENVNLPQLANDIITFTSVGLDPMLPNHINLIPYKNSHTNKYDIGFITGYRGLEIKAKKYGLDNPLHVIVELKFANDNFKLIKKDKDNEVEAYIFDVVEPFNRGELEGGFYYLIFEDDTKNKCVVFTIEDIEKRKPKYASAEFWGGEKDKWENGKKVGKESIAGWYHEMCWKTIYRAAYNSVTIDGAKIDQSFLRMAEIESSLPENKEVSLPAPNTKILPENSEVKKEVEPKIATQEESSKGIEKERDLPNEPNF